MTVLGRNDIHVMGNGPRTLMPAHRFGCDHTMWSAVVAAVAPQYRLMLFDDVGCGCCDYDAFDAGR